MPSCANNVFNIFEVLKNIFAANLLNYFTTYKREISNNSKG